MKSETLEKIDTLLEDIEHPDWLIGTGKTYIKVRVEDWSGVRDIKITVNDVANYYAKDVRNITSGIRTIGSYASDWRGIDEIAKFAFDYFKSINLEGMKKAATKVGIALKFD